MSFLYQIAILILALISFPKILYQRIEHGKYKDSLSKKMGKEFPVIEKGKRPLIWIHAVSLGEAKAVTTLAKAIKNRINNAVLVISSTTETGHAEAKKSLPFADYHVFLPFDLSFIINPIVKQTDPDLVILTESDFWFNFLQAAKESGSAIALVNGKISERSAKRFHWVQSFTNKLFSFFDILCIQNTYYAERFKSLNIPTNKMVITGNLKFDDVYPFLSDLDLAAFKDRLGIKLGDLVLVAGSTHDPEEKMLLDVSSNLRDKYPQLKIIIVPRHPERFDEVAALISQRQVPFHRYSQNEKNPQDAHIVLMDTMGFLRQCYQTANVAFVGGTFTEKVGGHNILEPCWYSVPVVFGPHMHSQPELLTLIKQYDGGIQTSAHEFQDQIENLLSNEAERLRLGTNGLRLIQDCQGAKQKTEEALEPFLKHISEKYQ